MSFISNIYTKCVCGQARITVLSIESVKKKRKKILCRLLPNVVEVYLYIYIYSEENKELRRGKNVHQQRVQRRVRRECIPKIQRFY